MPTQCGLWPTRRDRRHRVIHSCAIIHSSQAVCLLLIWKAYPEFTMTAGNQVSESLTTALTKAQIPSENHEFIRTITSAVGVVEFHTIVTAGKTYVKGRRQEGHRDLHINFGYTN